MIHLDMESFHESKVTALEQILHMELDIYSVGMSVDSFDFRQMELVEEVVPR
jgi:hypothetical protein